MLIHSVSVPFRRPCFGSLKVPHTLATQFAHQQLQRCDNSHLFNWKALHARTQKHSPTFTLTGRVLSHRCNNIWAARAVALGKTHLPVLAKPKGNMYSKGLTCSDERTPKGCSTTNLANTVFSTESLPKMPHCDHICSGKPQRSLRCVACKFRAS